MPALAAVTADLDAGHRAAARPGATFERRRLGRQEALAREEVGLAGRDHQRPRRHPVDGDALVLLGAAEAVAGRLLVAVEGLVHDVDPREPLDVRHPVPARNHQPEREAVLRRQRSAVQVVGEERIAAERLRERQRTPVTLLDASLDAAVEPGEDDLDRTLERFGLREQGGERGAAPASVADRLEQPGLADRPRLHSRPPVAGAFHRRDEVGRGPLAQVAERQRQRLRHAAADLEPPRIRVDRGNVVVDQQVVQPHGRDLVPQRLERHAVVPRRELELLEADVHSAHAKRSEAQAPALLRFLDPEAERLVRRDRLGRVAPDSMLAGPGPSSDAAPSTSRV